MMQFKENTDLMCILHIDWFLTHDHKTCGILSVIADILSQDLQSVKLSCLSAGNSCLRLVIVFAQVTQSFGIHKQSPGTMLPNGNIISGNCVQTEPFVV